MIDEWRAKSKRKPEIGFNIYSGDRHIWISGPIPKSFMLFPTKSNNKCETNKEKPRLNSLCLHFVYNPVAIEVGNECNIDLCPLKYSVPILRMLSTSSEVESIIDSNE